LNKSSTIEKLYHEALSVLQELIKVPSLSRQEDKTAVILEKYFSDKNIPVERVKNNLYAKNKNFAEGKKTILLNSHHDTVPPNKNYTNDPFRPLIKDDKLFGLGCNDAGAPLVSLLAAFLYFYEKEIPVNIIFAASAEEEVSGKDGTELLLTHLPKINMGIVGEPTQMKMAIAEKGLLVLDCEASGKAGHAARDEGENAIYKAIKDIQWLEEFSFEKKSKWLGSVHKAVTSIETENKAHNVVPSSCRFVVDVRVNDLYSFEEILDILKSKMKSKINPRSMRLKPSFISENHPLVKSGKALGMEVFGSPTCSDMALMDFPAVKCGPGNSARSHTADEFVYLHEIKEGISLYVDWLEKLFEN